MIRAACASSVSSPVEIEKLSGVFGPLATVFVVFTVLPLTLAVVVTLVDPPFARIPSAPTVQPAVSRICRASSRFCSVSATVSFLATIVSGIGLSMIVP